MELVYLWVKDYKNIENEGFNFSPRFECKFYDEYEKYTDEDGEEKERLKDNCKLDICDKKKNECKDNDYIENFFGKNINVTAIVGKNGSGKSSVLNTLVNTLENPYNYMVVFKYDNKIFYYSDIQLDTDLDKCTNISNKLKLVTCLDRENNDNIPIDIGATHYSKSNNSVWTKYKEIDISKEVIVRLLAVEIGEIDSSFKLSTFMYLPHKITIKLKTTGELLSENLSFTYAKNRDEIGKYFTSLDDIQHQYLIIQYLRKNGHSDNNILNTIKGERFVQDNSDLLFPNYLNFIVGQEIIINELSDEVKNTCIREGGYFHLFDFDLVDEKNRHYNDLSHGEKMIFGQLLNIYFYIAKDTAEQVFLLDEPEIALHPDWQKRYMNEILNLLKKSIVKNHFIFTSHSPFLLSDIPKQNIIFLDKDEKGNCKVVNGLKEKKQTFGANIHTLLSDSFFMEDGLMGEFAKGKIEEVINYLNNQESPIKDNDEAQKLINIIGEPIIKNQLQKMLDSKRLIKIDEIDNIRTEINDLEKRLKEIEDADDKS